MAALSGKLTCHLHYRAWALRSALPQPRVRPFGVVTSHLLCSFPSKSPGTSSLATSSYWTAILDPWRLGQDLTHL